MANLAWGGLGIKDKISYSVAVALFASGILLAFVCAVGNDWDIKTGILLYIAQAFVAGGSLMGVSLYFRNQLAEFEARFKSKTN